MLIEIQWLERRQLHLYFEPIDNPIYLRLLLQKLHIEHFCRLIIYPSLAKLVSLLYIIDQEKEKEKEKRNEIYNVKDETWICKWNKNWSINIVVIRCTQ